MRPFCVVLLLAACSGTPPPPPCVRAVCAEGDCGERLDGCGGRLTCGTCAGGETCGGAGPNRCGPGTCAPKTCSELAANCDFLSDGCSRVLDCGRCMNPTDCGADGTPNRCGGPSCIKRSCPLGACGPQGADDCGGTLDCGGCAAPMTCGGGGVAQRCGCTPKSCSEQGRDCGHIDDTCGTAISCGACATTVCGAARANSCAPCMGAGDRVCLPGCWCWESPRPFAQSIQQIAAGPGGDLWLMTGGSGAPGGTAIRRRAEKWDYFTLSSPGLPQVTSVWVAGVNEAWAAGSQSLPPATTPQALVLRFDGVSWRSQSIPTSQRLSGIWGSSASDVWAVGSNVILHWDGQRWDLAQQSQAEWTAVWGAAPNDVWAVGPGATHWDGSAWSPRMTIDVFNAVRGLASDAVWAAGASGVWRWDGTSWNSMMGMPGAFHVAPVAVDDVWVGGLGGLEHWDGTKWTTVFLGTSSTWVTGLQARAADDVWVAFEEELFHKGPNGWEHVNRSTRNDLFALVAPAPNEQWALASGSGTFYAGGRVYRGDGRSWQPSHDLPVRAQLFDLASAGGRTWIVGGDGLILESTDAGFSRIDGGTPAALWRIHAISANRAWAVGRNPTVLLAWDGIRWSPMSTPAGASTLASLWASADAGSVWVGDFGARVHRWDGTTWTTTSLQSGAQVDALWGADEELFAASNSLSPLFPGSLHRFDGASWTRIAVIDGGHSIRGIAGSSPSDVWFTGTNGTVLHWDGGTVAHVPVPTANNLSDVAVAGGTAWAVGDLGAILRFDSPALVDRQHLPGFTVAETAGGIGGTAADDVWVVGRSGGAYHWDGLRWTSHQVPSPVPAQGAARLGPVWAAARNDVWVIAEGWLLHWNGASWATTPPVGGGPHEAMWGHAPNDVWAVGSGGIIHWDGTTWSVSMSHGIASGLRAIWGVAADDVWAVGERVLHFDGTSWTSVSTPVTGTFTAVWCAAKNDCWTSTQSGQVIRWNGMAWDQNVPSLFVSEGFSNIWGFRGDDVYFFSNRGPVYRYDGARFSIVTELPAGRGPEHVWGYDAGIWMAHEFERALLFHPR